VDLDELIENPRYGREIKAEIMRRLEELDESYEQVAEAVDLPTEVVRKIAGKFGYSPEEHRAHMAERRHGEAEIWQPVPGQPRYEISSFGRLIDTRSGEVIERDALYRAGGQPRTRAELVTETFVGPRPPASVVSFKDGDTGNIFWGNLAWTDSPHRPTRVLRGLSRRLSSQERSDLVDDLRSKAPRAEIAERFGLSVSRVSDIAAEEGLGRDPSETRFAPKLSAGEKREIVRRARRGEPYSSIARRHGTTISTVSLAAKAEGIHRAPRLSDKEKEDIVRHHAAGESLASIARSRGVTRGAIGHIIERERLRAGLPKTRARPRPTFTAGEIAAIVGRRAAGESMNSLAKSFEVHRSVIMRVLRDMAP
jgi:transposase-like protein